MDYNKGDVRRMLYAIQHTKTGSYYSPTIEGKTQWLNREHAYTYESYDLAALHSTVIETDDFKIVDY